MVRLGPKLDGRVRVAQRAGPDLLPSARPLSRSSQCVRMCPVGDPAGMLGTQCDVANPDLPYGLAEPTRQVFPSTDGLYVAPMAGA